MTFSIIRLYQLLTCCDMETSSCFNKSWLLSSKVKMRDPSISIIDETLQRHWYIKYNVEMAFMVHCRSSTLAWPSLLPFIIYVKIIKDSRALYKNCPHFSLQFIQFHFIVWIHMVLQFRLIVWTAFGISLGLTSVLYFVC